MRPNTAFMARRKAALARIHEKCIRAAHPQYKSLKEAKMAEVHVAKCAFFYDGAMRSVESLSERGMQMLQGGLLGDIIGAPSSLSRILKAISSSGHFNAAGYENMSNLDRKILFVTSKWNWLDEDGRDLSLGDQSDACIFFIDQLMTNDSISFDKEAVRQFQEEN